MLFDFVQQPVLIEIISAVYKLFTDWQPGGSVSYLLKRSGPGLVRLKRGNTTRNSYMLITHLARSRQIEGTSEILTRTCGDITDCVAMIVCNSAMIDRMQVGPCSLSESPFSGPRLS